MPSPQKPPRASDRLVPVAVQFNPEPGNPKKNTRELLALLQKDTPRPGSLFVLPELSFTGYNLKPSSAYQTFSKTAVQQDIEPISAFCRNHQVSLIFGFIERVGGKLYNAQCLIKTDGKASAPYRKKNLFMHSRYTGDRYFSEGSAYHQLMLNGKKIGFGICMDINSQEFVSHYEQEKPDLLCISCAWIEEHIDVIRYWQSRLQRLRGIIVIANTWGSQNGITFAGRSCIFFKGKPLARAEPVGNGCISCG